MCVCFFLGFHLSHNDGHEIEKLQVFIGTLDQVIIHFSDLLKDDCLLEIAYVTAFHEHVVKLSHNLVTTVAIVDQVLN
jgi:hypothetical protein